MNTSATLHATIRDTVAALHADLVHWRRHLHRHPELSFQEHATAAFVGETLQREGIAVRTGVGRLAPDAKGTGLIAWVHGEAAPSDRCFALRADLDALPIQEEGNPAYCSTRPGVMHACGHDAHTAMVLGAGIALHRTRASWSGTVLLVFQPGEEKEPGGAALLIREGVFADTGPLGILGQHVTPELPTGTVAFRSGPFMAAADELYLTVKGRGGHAAVRDTLVDPILIAARMLPLLYDETRAATPHGQPVVLSFGKVVANGATNIVPDTVAVDGTLRTFDEALRSALHASLTTRAAAIARELGGDAELRIVKGSPVVKNDTDLTERMRAAAMEYLGADRVQEAPMRMGAEDFAYYTHVMPGCFYRLGTGNPAKPGTESGLHTSTFDVDEDALVIGAGLMAWGALRALGA
jgi:amidohydrolase